AIGVEFALGGVVIVVDAGGHLEAGPDEVLLVDVPDEDVLAAVVEGVQGRVAVLFGLAEVDNVVLRLVGIGVAEQTDGAVGVAEQEAAEVAVEELGADAQR